MMKNTIKNWSIAAMVAGLLMVTASNWANDLPGVTVYKSPTCGCCKKWVSHLGKNGFMVKAVNMKDMKSIKSMSGVKQEYASCHTAHVSGYTIEGHVPASDIKKLIKDKPKVRGITAPGMPMGSPGMEGPRKDKYQVLTFNNEGITGVYVKH